MSHNSYKLTWLYFKEIPFKASKDSPVRYGTDVLNFYTDHFTSPPENKTRKADSKPDAWFKIRFS